MSFSTRVCVVVAMVLAVAVVATANPLGPYEIFVVCLPRFAAQTHLPAHNIALRQPAAAASSCLCGCCDQNACHSYKVDPSKVTVGGLSAGAFMAVQMHVRITPHPTTHERRMSVLAPHTCSPPVWCHQVAFSEDVHGAAVLAGGPFMCAQNQEIVATTTCMNPNVLYKPPNATDLGK